MFVVKSKTMKRTLFTSFIIIGSALWLAETVFAAGGEHGGLEPFVLVGVAAILVAAKIVGEIFERLDQPAVLGELVAGIILGNLVLFGFMGAEQLKTNVVIAALAELGVIILLFEVGLESNLKEMKAVGVSAMLVAIAGVVAPFLLGWGVARFFIPEEATLTHIFIGATLCATSIGITARVLKDMGKLATSEARIILGAAVIDDVLGMLILAVVSGAIKAAAAGTTLVMMDIVFISAKAIGFLIVGIVLGQLVIPYLFKGANKLEGRGVLLATSLALCFFMSWAASKVGLAPIIGAFAAGLILDEVYFEYLHDHTKHDLIDLLSPVSTILAPIFFVVVGLKVDLSAFAKPELLGFATALTIAAIIGKQICSVAAIEKDLNRLSIGLGMIPRGEVGLIFAGIGATLMLPDAQGVAKPVINTAIFGVVVIMVIVTTLITPPALKWSMRNESKSKK
jgi:Kef-type K+ transport system membrane component KefB